MTSKAKAALLSTLYGFITVALGVKLYDGRDGGPDWQGAVSCWFENPRQRTKATLVTPNGAGKDEKIIGPLATALCALYRRATVVIFSKDGTQLDYQTWPHIERFQDRLSSRWTWNYRYIESPTGGRIIGRAVDDPKRAEGFHKLNDLDGPVFGIVNEAKSIPDNIFEAIDRWTFNGLLYISSPGIMQGRFYESHTRLASQFRYRRRVPLSQCPHISQEKIADMIATYGQDHPVVQSSIFANFVNQDDARRFVFPMNELDSILDYPPLPILGKKFGFCDFAAGGDENVFFVAHGNRLVMEDAWQDRNTMRAVDRFVYNFQRVGMEPADIWGDETGLGKPMLDRMAEIGWPVNRENNGDSPLNPIYENRGAEIWCEAAAAVRRREVVVPNDEVLRAQLTTRETIFASGGKMGVTPKKKLPKSPDRGDAFCGATCAYLGKMKTSGFVVIVG